MIRHIWASTTVPTQSQKESIPAELETIDPALAGRLQSPPLSTDDMVRNSIDFLVAMRGSNIYELNVHPCYLVSIGYGMSNVVELRNKPTLLYWNRSKDSWVALLP